MDKVAQTLHCAADTLPFRPARECLARKMSGGVGSHA